jgi:ATP-binding cassette subfamily B protein
MEAGKARPSKSRGTARALLVYSFVMGSPPMGALSGVFVLLVEDNEDARTILQFLLTYVGAFVTTAASAQSALDQLAQVKADVVVSDVNLDDNDTRWLIQQVRLHQSDTPFIAVSGRDYDRHEMRRAGFIAYLKKPVRQDVLVHKILKAVGR